MVWKSMNGHSAWHAIAMHGMCFDTEGCIRQSRLRSHNLLMNPSEEEQAQLFHAVMSGSIPVDAAAWTAASAAASAEPAAAEGGAAAEEVLWPFVPKAITSGRKKITRAKLYACSIAANLRLFQCHAQQRRGQSGWCIHWNSLYLGVC